MLVYKMSGLSTTQWQLLSTHVLTLESQSLSWKILLALDPTIPRRNELPENRSKLCKTQTLDNM